MNNHIFRLAAPVILSFTCSAPAPAIVTSFTNKSAWQSAVGNWTTIHFNEIPANSLVTNQYADLGVIFTDGSDFSLFAPTLFPNDMYGLNGADDEIAVTFDSPMQWIAVDFPGGVKFKLYNDGVLTYTSGNFGTLPINNFAGLVTDQPFDSAIILDPEGDVVIDDLHFGGPVPAPGGLVMLALSAFVTPRRRRQP